RSTSPTTWRRCSTSPWQPTRQRWMPPRRPDDRRRRTTGEPPSSTAPPLERELVSGARPLGRAPLTGTLRWMARRGSAEAHRQQRVALLRGDEQVVVALGLDAERVQRNGIDGLDGAVLDRAALIGRRFEVVGDRLRDVHDVRERTRMRT